MSDTDQPDTYSNAWYRKQFKGVQHSLNRCNADYAACSEELAEERKRVAFLEGHLSDVLAAIGELREQIGVLNGQMDKAREAFKALKNGSVS